MKLIVFAVSVCGLLALLAAAATAQSTVPGSSGTPTTQQGSLSAKSAATLRLVASSNLFEIESSRLALARSQSDAIKEFVDRMVAEHTRTASRMRQVLREAATASG